MNGQGDYSDYRFTSINCISLYSNLLDLPLLQFVPFSLGYRYIPGHPVLLGLPGRLVLRKQWYQPVFIEKDTAPNCEVCQTQNSQLSERGVVVIREFEFYLVNGWYILVYLIGNEAPWARKCETNQAFTAIQRRSSWMFCKNWTEGMQRYAKIVLFDGCYLQSRVFLRDVCKKKHVNVLKKGRELGQSSYIILSPI